MVSEARRPPYLRQVGETWQLVVDGQPFIMLGGELQNSSFSSSVHMNSVWSRLSSAHLNTVLAAVSWEELEPIEGVYDFANLDENIRGARQHGLKLVLLWFGSFKNGKSTYVPSWVKTNPHRFPRAELRSEDGQLHTADVLSIFGSNAQAADAAAFMALMHHIGETDQLHSTVVMVQVENEVGLLGDSRDRSMLAERCFNEPIPADLQAIFGDKSKCTQKLQENFARLDHAALPSNITWANLPAAPVKIDELFMAYHYCKYIEQVAAAGKAQYNIPLYTNVWQNYGDEDADPNVPIIVGGGSDPGDYPSGGGVEDVLDIWQRLTPSLDFIAPDVYLNDYNNSCRKYRHGNQPLFIPEQRRDEYGLRRAWAAIGRHQCLGIAPFGIDTMDDMDTTVGRHYRLLRDVSWYIIEAQNRPASTFGFYFDELSVEGKSGSSTRSISSSSKSGNDNDEVQEVVFGKWSLRIERSFVFGRPSAGCGMVIHLDESRFLLVGWGFQVAFTSLDKSAYFSGILRFEEQEIVDWRTGHMVRRRWLNGDETRSGDFAIMPAPNPDYGGFPISVTIPAKTGIAVCEPYALIRDESHGGNFLPISTTHKR